MYKFEFTFRRAVAGDGEAIAGVHYCAVRGIASQTYSREILEAWSPDPSPARAESFSKAILSGKEIFVVAEFKSIVCAFGSVVPEAGEVRAVYVDPGFRRKGVGSMILGQLEKIAAEHGVKRLNLDSSLNAEAFYLAQGYEPVERGLHQLSGGMVMACVKMTKTLGAAAAE
jgi:putative acetyltransferase